MQIFFLSNQTIFLYRFFLHTCSSSARNGQLFLLRQELEELTVSSDAGKCQGKNSFVYKRVLYLCVTMMLTAHLVGAR